MSTITLWTQNGCPLCAEVKAIFAGQDYEERDAAELLAGTTPDADAMVQLAMQDMQLPLVMLDGRFVPPLELIENAA